MSFFFVNLIEMDLSIDLRTTSAGGPWLNPPLNPPRPPPRPVR